MPQEPGHKRDGTPRASNLPPLPPGIVLPTELAPRGGQGVRKVCRKPVYFMKHLEKHRRCSPGVKQVPWGTGGCRGCAAAPTPLESPLQAATSTVFLVLAPRSSATLGWLLPEERLDGVAGSHGLDEADVRVRDPKGHVHGGAVRKAEGMGAQWGQWGPFTRDQNGATHRFRTTRTTAPSGRRKAECSRSQRRHFLETASPTRCEPSGMNLLWGQAGSECGT